MTIPTNDTPAIGGAVPCIRCGYSLRGIAIAGECPECGGPAVESLAATRGTTKRQVAELAARMLALWLVVWNLADGVQLIAVAFSWQSPANNWSSATFAAAYVFSGLAVGAGVWFAAPWVARQMVPTDGLAMVRQAWTADDLMAVATSILGLYLAATGLANLVAMLVSGNFVGVFVDAAVRTALGAALLVGRWRIAGWITRARTAGTPA